LICPNCQLIDIAADAKICPRCGDVLTGRPTLSENEIDNIKEKSILRGKIAELESRAKTRRSKISELRTYVILLLIILLFGKFLCNKKKLPSISAFGSHIEAEFAAEQLQFHRFVMKELMHEAPTFLYITTYGDNPETLSRAFYKNRNYVDTILVDNYIYNDKQIPTGDTLILRKNPIQPISNILEIKAIQKAELIKGDKGVLRDLNIGQDE
jgi:hypothetical protein